MARQAPFQQSGVIYAPIPPLPSLPQCPFLKGKQKYRNKCDKASVQKSWVKLLRQNHIIIMKQKKSLILLSPCSIPHFRMAATLWGSDKSRESSGLHRLIWALQQSLRGVSRWLSLALGSWVSVVSFQAARLWDTTGLYTFYVLRTITSTKFQKKLVSTTQNTIWTIWSLRNSFIPEPYCSPPWHFVVVVLLLLLLSHTDTSLDHSARWSLGDHTEFTPP